MQSTKIVLKITQFALVLVAIGLAITQLRFLANHTRIIIASSLLVPAWFVALFSAPFAIYSITKRHDQAAKLAFIFSITIVLSPIVVWLIFVVAMAIGAHSNPL